MKLKASTAVEADTLGHWLTRLGHPYQRDGFVFTTPTPVDHEPTGWLAWVKVCARVNDESLKQVELVGE